MSTLSGERHRSGSAPGSIPSGPIITGSSNARSPTLRASGPISLVGVHRAFATLDVVDARIEVNLNVRSVIK
jgi:hypothetical protein